MPRWQQTWILRKLQNCEKGITEQMSQAAEVCFLNKMRKELEERRGPKEYTFLLSPAKTPNLHLESNEIVSVLPFHSTFDNRPAFSSSYLAISVLTELFKSHYSGKEKKTLKPHIQEGDKNQKGIWGFGSSWVRVKELLPFCPGFPNQFSCAAFLKGVHEVCAWLQASPSVPNGIVCAALMYLETAVDELHTWMPVNVVRTTLILFYVIYFMKFSYS